MEEIIMKSIFQRQMILTLGQRDVKMSNAFGVDLRELGEPYIGLAERNIPNSSDVGFDVASVALVAFDTIGE